MIRTAEEIFTHLWVIHNSKKNDPEMQLHLSIDEIELIAEAMKQYAKEVLEHAADKVNYPYRDEYGCHCDVPSIVLNIINQLK